LFCTLRVPFGSWAAEDMDGDLDIEIEMKFGSGYARDG